MIWFLATAFVALISIAVTVGVMEARQAAAWRDVAHYRRERWERDHRPDDEDS